MPSAHESQLASPIRTMRVAVPYGCSTLLVTPEIPLDDRICSEVQLMHFGRAVFGEALTQEYGWRHDGQINYIADQIGLAEGVMRQLTRHLYERRHIPKPSGEEPWLYRAHDHNHPGIHILPLTI